ncbi:MAG: hypothetical protein ACREJC_21140 [Tepidisphaeraceae bacterium]
MKLLIQTVLAIGLGSCAALLAQDKPPAISDPKPILPGRPDSADPPGASDLLGDRFESLSAGISFRAPAGCREIRRAAGDEIVQYVNDQKRWVLRVSRLALSAPLPLLKHKDKDGHDVNGLIEETSDRIKLQTPAAEILRQDIVHIGQTDVGLIAARYTVGVDTNLTQQALIRATDSLYYILDLTVTAPREGDIAEDPGVRLAVDTFNQVLDSVKILDQSEIRDEQNQRLYRTRTLFVNLTEPRLKNALVKEQWLRFIRDGKDIGYSYIVQETAHDLPRAGKRQAAQGGADGILVGVRSRTMPDAGVKVDAESWMWMSVDRKHEKWSNVALIETPGGARETLGDFGSTDAEIKNVLDQNLLPGEKLGPGEKDVDKNQPPVRPTEVYTLNVTSVGKSKGGPPVTRQLPPWYMPQALGQIMPGLLSQFSQKTYLFATFVSDRREVMMRYIDVLPEQQVDLEGRPTRAIPVKDRIGLEGSVTTHYFSREGKFLGSVNPDQKIVILPTDAAALTQLWQNADLSRPKDVPDR